MANTDPKRAVTGQSRLSYVHLTRPRQGQNPGEPERYSVTVLIPKSDTVAMQRIDASIESAKQDGIANKWRGACPPQLTTPVHDGDGLKRNGEPYGPECKGHWVVTASCNADRRPEVVDVNCNAIMDATQIYSGMYGRVTIRFFAYDTNGNRGIGAGLGNVQKLADGEPLGGYVSAEADFADAPPVQQSYQPQAQPGYVQPPHQAYTQPAQQYRHPYQTPAQPAVDPITGAPVGGVMGI